MNCLQKYPKGEDQLVSRTVNMGAGWRNPADWKRPPRKRPEGKGKENGRDLDGLALKSIFHMGHFRATFLFLFIYFFWKGAHSLNKNFALFT